jgi:photosystem II stability/assembly factor-like uncharacterized protein
MGRDPLVDDAFGVVENKTAQAVQEIAALSRSVRSLIEASRCRDRGRRTAAQSKFAIVGSWVTRRCAATIGVLALGLLGVLAPVAVASVAPLTSTTPLWTQRSSTFAFADVACPTTKICVAIDGQDHVARSSNGGLSWKSVAVPVHVVATSDISCSSASRCVIAAVGGTLGASSQPPRFLVTKDAGAHWTLVAPPDGVTSIDAVDCPTVTECVGMGASTNPNRGEMLMSSNGGSSWRTESAFADPGFGGIACVTASTCVRASGGYNDNGPVPEVVAVTRDGGRTFTSLGTLPGVEQVNRLACPTVTTCLAVGSSLTQGEPTPGDGIAYATTNGGRSWHRAAVPSATTELNGVACVSERECFALADAATSNALTSTYGMILSTTDSGAHWTAQLQGANVPTSSIACVRQGHCVAVGSNRYALKGS